MSEPIPSPEEFFGFQLGSDRKIARWDQIVTYFGRLEQQSDRIRVIDLGPSTEGHPFLLAIISAPENVERLEELKAINAQISDPRGVSDARIPELVAAGRAVICQSMSLHATEISGTQMAPELAYELITGSDAATRAILDQVIFLMIPCSNPDGQIMVTDWYQQHLGTEYEGCRLPWLYHRYAGHDNNRDAFMTQLVESRYVARVLFQEWRPQAYQDLHEMGSYTARFYVAPYSEPIHPHADPLVWREINWYGAHMAYKLEEAGKAGVLNAAYFAGWCHLGFHWIGLYHNIASMLTEGAPAKLATPLYVHQSQLGGEGTGTLRAFPHYKAQTNFPHPWEGGWWRLRDLVEYQKTAARALLEMAARHRETILQNAVRKARQQTERGAAGQPAAFVIPAQQHDPLTALKLVQKLFSQGIEIQKATQAFTDGDVTYPAGSPVIPLAQPKMGLIRSLLERTRYPDDAWTRLPDGSPVRPYDTATDTFGEFMGCDVRPVGSGFAGRVETIREPERPAGTRTGVSTLGYLFDGRLNDSFAALNAFLRQRIEVQRLDDAVALGETMLPPGAFRVPAGCEDVIDAFARQTGIPFHALDREPQEPQHVVKVSRIGIYQRFWGGNMDEGWTRLVLEQFGFPYTTLNDEAITKGELNQSLDVILFPHDSLVAITGNEERFKDETVPPEYRSGIGDEGVEAIKAFVTGGGTLILLNQACELAFEKLGLKVENLLKDVPSREFFCPGSTLRARVDIRHPLAYGMPAEALLFCWDSPAFRITPSPFNERCEVVVEYPPSEILQSGWLIGEARIAGRAAMVAVRSGQGRVILFGFRPQHRAQTHGTFKLLFNALLG